MLDALARRPARLFMAATLLLLLTRAGTTLADPATATVNSSDGLNLRSGPGTTFDVLTVLPNGAQVTVIGATTAGDWLQVSYNGQLGWAIAAYLTLPQGASNPTTTVVVLPSDGLNLRSGAGPSFDVVTVLPGGATLSVTGSAQDAWLPVSYNGQTGWVDAAYVSSDGGSPMITSSASGASAPAVVANVAARPAQSAPAAAATRSTAASDSGTRQSGLAWPVPSRRVTTVFSASHPGIDISEIDEVGGPVTASAAGTVTFAGGDPCCSYGLYVVIDHGNGLSTLYAHFSKLEVQKGQVVTLGQRLGRSGCTGNCTGPHVHFEVHVNDHPVDPLTFLPPPWHIE